MSGDQAQEDERGEDGEVLGALQDGRSARTEREGADRGGEGEQDDLLPVESEDELIEGAPVRIVSAINALMATWAW